MDWTKANIVPRAGLEGWRQYEAGASGHNIIFDYSGKNRHVNCSAGNSPVLTANVLNGQPGWYFNGSRDPLVYNFLFPAKHIFCVASYEDATFSGNNGLLSGTTTYGIFVGDGAGTNKFFHFPEFGSYTYRKNDVSYATNNLLAPVVNNFAVLELLIPAGITLAGLHIGQDRAFTDRKWKGYFFEDLIYSTEKNASERKLIYEYFAMRYKLWRQNADGLNIFPFVADRERNVERNRETYQSKPYSGDKKALVKDFSRSFQLPFNLRLQQEFEAAESFHAQHHPLTDFIYEDYKYIPAKPRTINFASGITDQGSDVSHRFNYSFEAVEAN